jgi:hypothetical protein
MPKDSRIVPFQVVARSQRVAPAAPALSPRLGALMRDLQQLESSPSAHALESIRLFVAEQLAKHPVDRSRLPPELPSVRAYRQLKELEYQRPYAFDVIAGMMDWALAGGPIGEGE